MSKFWAGSSEDESDQEEKVSQVDEEDEEDSSSQDGSDESGEESEEQEDGQEAALDWSDSDEDDTDTHARRILPKHTQTMNEIEQINEKIRNALNINDWTTIQTQYDQLNKSVEKYLKVTNSQSIPNQYIIILVDLEDGLVETLSNRDQVKRMHAPNAKSLNRMKQQIKKNNLQYKELLDSYRDNPEEFTHVEEETDVQEQKEKIQQQQLETTKEEPEELTYMSINQKVREAFETRGRRNVNRREQIRILQALLELAMGPAQKILVLQYLIQFIFDGVQNMARTLSRSQWKQCIAYMYQVMEILNEHSNITTDENYEDSFERKEEVEGEDVVVWGNLVAQVERLDEELFKSLQIADHRTNEFKDRLSDQPLYMALAEQVFNYCKRMEQKSKMARLAIKQMEHFYFFTEPAFNALRSYVRSQNEQSQTTDSLAQQNGVAHSPTTATTNGANQHENSQVAHANTFARLTNGVQVEEDVWANLRIPHGFYIPESQQELLDQLQDICYNYGDDRIKYRSTLCRVYNLCIHNKYFQARDLMLVSRSYEAISQLDIMTLVLYNRALAQLGLCAFRASHMHESFSILNELYSQGRIRELLAQGMVVNRNQEKTVEQEKLEKSRQMPFHLHINLEVLEAQHLITAMLIEVPNMAANPLNAKTKQSSKQFYRYLDEYDKKLYTGTPESVRDHTMAATKALQKGNWKQSLEYISKLQCWNLVPDKIAILDMIKEKLKEIALRTFLFSYSQCYESISLQSLQEMFELTQKKVHSMVSKMMIQEELLGRWDEPTKTISVYKVDVSRVQEQALSLVDKVSLLVDMNERALALSTGSFNNYEDDQQPSRRGDMDSQIGGRGRSRAFGVGQQFGQFKNAGDGYDRKWDNRGMRKGQRGPFQYNKGQFNKQKMVQLGGQEIGRGRRQFQNRDYNQNKDYISNKDFGQSRDYRDQSHQQSREAY